MKAYKQVHALTLMDVKQRHVKTVPNVLTFRHQLKPQNTGRLILLEQMALTIGKCPLTENPL